MAKPTGDESVKLPSTALQYVGDQASERGMFKRAVLCSMIELWRISGEAKRRAAIARQSRHTRPGTAN